MSKLKMSKSIKTPKSKIKIALDTNVFRKISFLQFLDLNKFRFKVLLPTIVGLEYGYFQMRTGISWDDYQKNLEQQHLEILPWNSIILRDTLIRAVENKEKLPFKEHFRDFLIGIQCLQENLILITYNITHFQWDQKLITYTPETAYFLWKDKIL